MKACSQALRIFTMLCNFHPGHFITLIFIKQLFPLLSSPQLLETMNLLSVFHKFIYSEIFNKGTILWLAAGTHFFGGWQKTSVCHTFVTLLTQATNTHLGCFYLLLIMNAVTPSSSRYPNTSIYLTTCRMFFVVLGIDSNIKESPVPLMCSPSLNICF